MAAQDYISVVQQLYVSYFGRPADYYGLDNFTKQLAAIDTAGALKDFKSLSAAANAAAPTSKLGLLINSFSGSAEAAALYGTDTSISGTSKFVAAVYQNILGREADVEGLTFWVNAIQSGALTRANAAAAITEGAMSNTSAQGLLDAKTVANKNAVATAFTAAIDTTKEINGYSGEKAAEAARAMLNTVNSSTDTAAFQATVESTLVSIVDGVNTGGTFTLTKGLDTINGGSGNDLIIGAIDAPGGNVELNTLNGIDNINGGSGIDTLKIAHNGGDITVGNLTNVEIVTIDSAALAGVTVNTSTVAGITDLKVTKTASIVDATVSATTNVDVSLKDSGNVTVKGAKDVNVVLTDAVSTIDVGHSGADVSGNVNISTTSKAVANNGTVTMGNILVGGGKTVTVAQHIGNISAMVADGVAETATQGNVTVVASSITTDVTVTQDAAQDSWSREAKTGVTEVASVKFTALLKDETVTVGGLTFTAAKDLTADQVAQAFANLSASAVAPDQLPTSPATGDTQGSGVRANGVFTGSLLANWSSAAATGDTVVFTGKANTSMTDLVASAKATALTTTQGVTAVTAKNDLGIVNGTVTIDGAAALKNVTVDGFAASTGGAGINGATNTALSTITLKNGESFDIDSAAATLALNLADVYGTVSVAAGTKTLNAKVDGDFGTTTLASATTETLNVSGTGNVAGSTAAGLGVATSINTSGMTAGTASFTIADGGATSYTGGAVSDRVTINNAGTAITKAIDLGAGNDRLTLSGTVVVPTATLKGGAGTDTIAMNGASAVAMSANGDFAAKIDGFEKLSITDTVATATTVNMANMDGINYVISKNSVGTSGSGVKEVFTVDLGTSGTITGADTITFAGTTITLAGGETPAQVAQKVAFGTYAGWTVTGLNGTVVTFEKAAVGTVTDIVAADFAIVDVDATTAAVAPTVTTQGTNTYTLDFTGAALTNNDTVTIGSYVYTAGGALTAAQLVTAIVGASPITIDGKSYVATDGAGDTLVLTTTDATAPASLTYVAAEVGGDGGFVAGAGNNVAAAKANGATEVFAAAFAGSGAIEDGDTIVFDGVTITLATGDTPATIAAKVAAQSANFANYTAAVDGVTNTTVNFTAKTAGVKADAVVGNFTITNVNVANNATQPKVVVNTTVQGVGAGGATGPALTIDKMANAGTLELVEAGAGVIVKMADATGSTDSFNIVTKVAASNLDFGVLDIAGVETIKFTATDLELPPTYAAVNTATVALKADKATSLTIDGSSNVTLTLDAATTKLATIDATALTGKLDVTANGANAMTITGGAGADTLRASTGATAKADIINGGAGKDIIYAGTNGAKLTGGDGNDLFIVSSAAADGGNKESNTYSEITDFKAGDVVQLRAFVGGAAVDAAGFAKLAATLNETTAVFSDFVNAAVKEAGAGAAVWFSFKGDTYVVVDSNTNTDTFVNGDDLIVKLTGINGDNLSWNADFATISLV